MLSILFQFWTKSCPEKSPYSILDMTLTDVDILS